MYVRAWATPTRQRLPALPYSVALVYSSAASWMSDTYCCTLVLPVTLVDGSMHHASCSCFPFGRPSVPVSLDYGRYTLRCLPARTYPLRFFVMYVTPLPSMVLHRTQKSH